MIAFIGSVFSPYYALARKRDRGDPFNHVCMHVVLYGERGKRWAMTERTADQLSANRADLNIGPSTMAWDGNALTVDFAEITAPIPRRFSGRIRLVPEQVYTRATHLDARNEHRWWPISPRSRVECSFDHPDLAWSGNGYLDSNGGDVPLEASFDNWNWSRAALGDGAAILYYVNRLDGSRREVAYRFDGKGTVDDFDPPRAQALPSTGWRVARETGVGDGQTASVEKTLEDTPFYSRSVVASHLLGEPVKAMHESLDMRRFTRPWVQFMLPFKVPRRWW